MWLWTLKTGLTNGRDGEAAEDDSGEGEEEDGAKNGSVGGFVLEFDAARKIAQGLGVHLEKAPSIVQVRGDTVRLLPVGERAAHLFGKRVEAEQRASGRGQRKKPKQVDLFDDLRGGNADKQGERGPWLGEQGVPQAGATVLDRVHQAMILFGANRGEAMRRFLDEDGVGRDARFWRLAQALAALYPAGTDEKRWVEGVLARKKGLGL